MLGSISVGAVVEGAWLRYRTEKPPSWNDRNDPLIEDRIIKNVLLPVRKGG